MKVGIVGAGMAGLSAAKKLTAAGVSVKIFEKSHVLGGRVATRKVGDYYFDTGATSISPRHLDLSAVMQKELDTEELVKIQKPIWAMEHGRVMPGDPARNAMERFVYRSGVNKLARLLAENLDIQRECLITEIGQDGHLNIQGEDFDWVILTAPVTQSQSLLTNARDQRDLGQIGYRSCLSVLLGYKVPDPVVQYHALIDVEQRQPVVWVSLESVKSPGRAPEGHSAFVVQMNSNYSKMRYEGAEDEVIHEATNLLGRLYGAEYETPEIAQVKKWKYSQSELPMSFEEANRGDTKILVAGDGISGPRVELAFQSGIEAAERILGSV